MSKPKDKDDFLKKPGYPGGDEALNDFIVKNLKYPEEAKAAKIEGTVIVDYHVTDNGVVSQAQVIKSIGYGCDEEALRLIRLLKFGKVRNKKLRVKVRKKTRIHFKLPQLKINYSVSSTKESSQNKTQTISGDKDSGYSYTINIPNKNG